MNEKHVHISLEDIFLVDFLVHLQCSDAAVSRH